MNVAAILLAAGCSSRFEGGDKLLAELEGKPLILRAAQALAGSAACELVVVTRTTDAARRAALASIPARHVVNDAPGQAKSLAAGIAAIDRSATAAVVLPADMPLVTSRDIDRLIAEFTRSMGRKIIYCRAGSGRRPPVLWPSSFFPELSRLTGDTGGKGLLAEYPDLRRAVTIADTCTHRFEDVDTKEDLVGIRQRLAASPSKRPATHTPQPD